MKVNYELRKNESCIENIGADPFFFKLLFVIFWGGLILATGVLFVKRMHVGDFFSMIFLPLFLIIFIIFFIVRAIRLYMGIMYTLKYWSPANKAILEMRIFPDFVIRGSDCDGVILVDKTNSLIYINGYIFNFSDIANYSYHGEGNSGYIQVFTKCGQAFNIRLNNYTDAGMAFGRINALFNA